MYSLNISSILFIISYFSFAFIEPVGLVRISPCSIISFVHTCCIYVTRSLYFLTLFIDPSLLSLPTMILNFWVQISVFFPILWYCLLSLCFSLEFYMLSIRSILVYLPFHANVTSISHSRFFFDFVVWFKTYSFITDLYKVRWINCSLNYAEI